MKARAAITINTAPCFSPGFWVAMSPLLSAYSASQVVGFGPLPDSDVERRRSRCHSQHYFDSVRASVADPYRPRQNVLPFTLLNSRPACKEGSNGPDSMAPRHLQIPGSVEYAADAM